MLDGPTLHYNYDKCAKPDCSRIVKKGTVYCCAACGRADDGGYEIHSDGVLGHSASCNARHAERGDWPFWMPSENSRFAAHRRKSIEPAHPNT